MKKLILLFGLFLTLSLYAQNLERTVELVSSAGDQKIEITYTFDRNADSIVYPQYQNFRKIEGGSRSYRISIDEGVRTEKTEWRYLLRPLKTGPLEVPSPVIYHDGQSYALPPFTLNIEEPLTVWSADSYEELRQGGKPLGTRRIVYYEGIGYLEERRATGWEMIRPLKEEELKMLEDLE